MDLVRLRKKTIYTTKPICALNNMLVSYLAMIIINCLQKKEWVTKSWLVHLEEPLFLEWWSTYGRIFFLFYTKEKISTITNTLLSWILGLMCFSFFFFFFSFFSLGHFFLFALSPFYASGWGMGVMFLPLSWFCS